MGLADLLKNAGRALTLTAALYNCGGEEKEGCQRDTDCYAPRVCVRGYCEGGNGGDNNPAGERFCEQYNDICPGSLSWADECEKYCTPKRTFNVNSKEFSDDCLFVYCLNDAGYCLDPNNPDTSQGKDVPDVLKCFESYDFYLKD